MPHGTLDSCRVIWQSQSALAEQEYCSPRDGSSGKTCMDRYLIVAEFWAATSQEQPSQQCHWHFLQDPYSQNTCLIRLCTFVPCYWRGHGRLQSQSRSHNLPVSVSDVSMPQGRVLPNQSH